MSVDTVKAHLAAFGSGSMSAKRCNKKAVTFSERDSLFFIRL